MTFNRKVHSLLMTSAMLMLSACAPMATMRPYCPPEAPQCAAAKACPVCPACPPPPSPQVPFWALMAVELKPVFFDAGQTTVDSAAEAVLAANLEAMGRQPTLIVVVTGHADKRGIAPEKKRSAWARAKAVAAYYTRAGVPEDRIHIAAYADKDAKCDEQTAECNARNRRVETEAIIKPQ